MSQEKLKSTIFTFFNLGDAPAAACVRIAKGGDNAGTIAIIGVVPVRTNVGCFRGPCSAGNLPVTVQIKSENGLVLNTRSRCGVIVIDNDVRAYVLAIDIKLETEIIVVEPRAAIPLRLVIPVCKNQKSIVEWIFFHVSQRV